MNPARRSHWRLGQAFGHEPAGTPAPRLPFLDGLRVSALALLLPYHVAMYDVSWDWHVKSPAASTALEPFLVLTAPWRLGLLFLVAGAACQGPAASRGWRGAIKDRTKRLLLPALPLALARCFVMPGHPSTHNFVADPYNHLLYGWLFALGWASRTPLADTMWEALLSWRWHTLLAALASWALLVAYFCHFVEQRPPPLLLAAQRVLWACMSGWGIAAACGWAQRCFEQPSPAMAAVSRAVFCVDVLHQTVIVLLTQALKPLALPWGLEALLLLALTLALSVIGYGLARQVPGLALLLGIQRGSQRQLALPAQRPGY